MEFAESRPLGRLSAYALVLFWAVFLEGAKKRTQGRLPEGLFHLMDPFHFCSTLICTTFPSRGEQSPIYWRLAASESGKRHRVLVTPPTVGSKRCRSMPTPRFGCVKANATDISTLTVSAANVTEYPRKPPTLLCAKRSAQRVRAGGRVAFSFLPMAFPRFLVPESHSAARCLNPRSCPAGRGWNFVIVPV